MTTIDVLFFDGCEALDAIGPLEVLGHAGLDVRPVALEGAQAVRTGQGLRIQVEAPRDGAEWLIVPGGGWDARAVHDAQAAALTGSQ